MKLHVCVFREKYDIKKKNGVMKSVYYVAEYGTILMSVFNSVFYIHIVRLRCPGF